MATHSFDVLIIGSGFAGAATAFHLSRAFSGTIGIVEQEKTPGAHASGRNAALLLQSVADPQIRRAAVASRVAYGEIRDRLGFQRKARCCWVDPSNWPRSVNPGCWRANSSTRIKRGR